MNSADAFEAITTAKYSSSLRECDRLSVGAFALMCALQEVPPDRLSRVVADVQNFASTVSAEKTASDPYSYELPMRSTP